jgi:phage gp36-like protein
MRLAFSSIVVVLALVAFSFNAMAYVELADLKGKIPNRDLVAALDDNKDNAIDNDVWAQIQNDVQAEIDGYLGQRCLVPFTDPLPSLIKVAARVFAIEAVLERRHLLNEKSPDRINAQKMRAKLIDIADAKEPLPLELTRGKRAGKVISEPSRTQSDRPAL